MRKRGIHKKLTSILIAAAMVVTCVPVSAAAPGNLPEGVVLEEAEEVEAVKAPVVEETVTKAEEEGAAEADGTEGSTQESDVAKIGETSYGSLQEAIDAVQSGETITLLKDADNGDQMISTNKNFILDLAGKRIFSTNKYVLQLSGNNIICDSSQEKSGEIINKSTIEVHNYAVRVDGGSVEVQGGTFIGAYGMRVVKGGSISFKGGTAKGTKYGIVVSGGGTNGKKTTLSVSGGTIESDSKAISGQGVEDNTKIEITGGNIISKDLGIYHPQEGDLTIGGNAKIEAPNGVQYCGSGNLIISDNATIHATGAYTSFPSKPSGQGDGSADDGAALSLVSRGDGYQDNGKKMNVTINGGTLISDNNAAISAYRLQKITEGGIEKWVTNEKTTVDNFLESLRITGGVINGTKDIKVKPVLEVDAAAANSIKVSGGIYNQIIPAKYCERGFAVKERDDGTYGVVADKVASVNGEVYATLQEAVDAANDSGTTITLLKDCVSNGTVIIKNRDIVLDLGGHTLKAVNAEGKSYTVLKTIASTLVIQNGKIETANKVWAAAVGCDRESKLTIAEDAVISGDYGIAINRYFTESDVSTAGSGTVIHIYGKVEGIDDPEVLKAGGRGGMTIVGSVKSRDDYPKIHIHSGAVIKGYSGTSGKVNDDDAPAIYAAGYGEWTIEEGAELSGDEALSIKAGIFHINGGKFNGYGAFNAVPDAWSNGTEPTGAAISITGNTDYARNVQMTINGGTFEAENGYALVEAVTKGDSAFGKLSINGGVFTGGQDKAIYISKEDKTKFVSGGYFGQPIDDKYIAEDKVLLPDETYGYRIGDDSVAEAKPAVGESQVDMEGTDIPEHLKNDVEKAAKEVTVNEQELTVYARQAASEVSKEKADDAVKQAKEELTPGENELIHVYAQTFLDIKPVTFKASGSGTAAVYTLDIVPKYQLVASTADSSDNFIFKDEATSGEAANAVKVGEAEELENVTNISISIPLPEDFLNDSANLPDALWVKHEGKKGVFYHDAKLTKAADNSYSVSFFNKEGFSVFTILAAGTVAEVNGTGYTSLAAAIEAANGGEVVVLSDVTEDVVAPENANATLNMNGHTITGTLTNKGTLTIKGGKITDDITSNGTTYIESGEFNGALVKGENGKFSISGGTFTDGQLKPEYIAPGHVIDGNTVRPATPSGGGGTTTPSYTITTPAETEGGKVIASANSANQGDTVTLTVEAKEGYELDELIVTDASGAKIELTKTADGKFTFQMPGSNVEIKASFKVEGQQEQEIKILKAQARDLADRTLNDKDTKVKFAKGKAPKTDVTYESSNDKVVAVDEEGHIHYTGLGEAVITVKAAETEEYKAAEVSVTVKVGLKQPTFTPSARDNGFAVTSSTVKGAEKFQVQYVLKGRSFKNESAKSKTFTVDNKLRKGKVSAANKKTYRIRVRAINGDVKSKWSPVKTITTK